MDAVLNISSKAIQPVEVGLVSSPNDTMVAKELEKKAPYDPSKVSKLSSLQE